jgi:hypothetical protein
VLEPLDPRLCRETLRPVNNGSLYRDDLEPGGRKAGVLIFPLESVPCDVDGFC